MLVYLDTAQFDWLERARTHDTALLSAFLEVWNAKGCALALSRAHMHEFGQIPDNESMARRLGVLELFPDLRYADANPDRIAEHEFGFQTLRRLAKLELDDPTTYSDLRGGLFPTSTWTRAANWLLRNRDGLLMERSVRDQLAQQDNFYLELLKVQQSRSDKRAPLEWRFTPDSALMNQFSELGVPMPLLERMRACSSKAKTEREYKICLSELERFAFVARAPVEDLVLLSNHVRLADDFVLPYCRAVGYADPEINEAINSYNPYHSPATSLRLAVERGRRAARMKRKPGDYIDADHAMCAAHVDSAFVDRRTWEYIGQQRRTHPKLLSLYANPNIRRARDLNDVVNQISEFGVL